MSDSFNIMRPFEVQIPFLRFLMGRDKSRARLHAAQQRSNSDLEQQFDVLRHKLVEVRFSLNGCELVILFIKFLIILLQFLITSRSCVV